MIKCPYSSEVEFIIDSEYWYLLVIHMIPSYLIPSRDFMLLMPKLSFPEKNRAEMRLYPNELEPSRDSGKTNPSRADTITKRARAKLRL